MASVCYGVYIDVGSTLPRSQQVTVQLANESKLVARSADDPPPLLLVFSFVNRVV